MVQSFGVTQSFLNAWKYISNTGVEPEFDDNTIKKIVLSNQISIAMLVLVTLSTIIFGYDNGFSGLALAIGAINIVPIATISLNALGFVGASRVVLGTLTPFIVLVNIVSLKVMSTPETFPIGEYHFYTPRYYLAVVALLPLFVIDFNEKRLLYTALFLNALWLLLFDNAHDMMNVGVTDFGFEKRSYFQTSVMTVILLLFMYSGVLLFKRETMLYELKINQLLENEKENNSRVKSEIDLGRKVIEGLLPKNMPRNEFYQSAALLKWCNEVGGDYYTSKEIDENRTLFLIADVSGKGLPASIIVTAIHSIIETQLNTEIFDLKTFILRLNELLCSITDDMKYATIWAGVYDASKKELESSTCGHPPPFLYSPEIDNVIQMPNTGGTILGFFNNYEVKSEKIKVQPGTIIFAYTDGLSEANSPGNVMIQNTDYIEKLIAANKHLNPEELNSTVYDYLVNYMKSDIFDDDLTILTLKFA